MNKGLLLGAGFSYDLGMPLSVEFTEVFLGVFNKRNVKSLATALAQNDPYSSGRPINKEAIFNGFDLLLEYKKNKGKNYEEFLQIIQDKQNELGSSQSDKDSYNYLFSVFYEIVHTILSMYQKLSYETIYDKNIRWFSSLENLLSDKETWVFTLNHDLYMECLALDYGIPITYGDNENISFPLSNIEMDKKVNLTCSRRSSLASSDAGFFRGKRGINLVKLHGGLSELQYKDNEILCNLPLNYESSNELVTNFKQLENMAYYHQGQKVPSGKDRSITDSNGELDIISKSMLTGGSKYSKTSKIKKGEEKLKIFDEQLMKLDELTVIGYGFGDKHVNFRLSNAMLLNENLTIRIVDPVNCKPPEILEQFDFDSRIRGASCGAAHWMDYCVSEKWDSEQINALKENVKYRDIVKTKVEAAIMAGAFN